MPAPLDCIACPLNQYRKTVVNGVIEGEGTPELLIIGESPGYQEDQLGRPFIGPTGAILKQELGLRGIETYALTNSMRCYPGDTKKDSEMEAGLTACNPYLLQDIETLKPKVILALGAYAVRALGFDDPITTIMCHILDGPYGVPVVVSYHPAAFMRQPGSLHLFELAVLKTKLLIHGERYGERWEPQVLTLEEFMKQARRGEG